MITLSVNIDHIATLRQARQEPFPDPVQAAGLVELGGADGITVHLRQDRRHINERDVRLLRQTIKTELTVEMTAVQDIIRLVTGVRPDQVTLVPELATELTTTQGLDVQKRFAELRPVVARLRKAGIRVSMFIEPDERQVRASAEIGAQVVELNTDKYSKEVGRRPVHLGRLAEAAECAREQGLVVHVGHGLDYRNVVPIAERKIAHGFSIGFAIVARAVFVGLVEAVREMKHILEVSS
ncbi:MAG: pyridoxine 5'-phosphate synthase [candidate division WOR-3 bacterium]